MKLDQLNKLYKKYNRREFIHPDPLEYLYKYESSQDKEVVAVIASALAYGRVAQILKSIGSALRRIDPSPYKFIKKSSEKTIKEKFRGFKHRFAEGNDMAFLLIGLKKVLKKYSSLNECFLAGYKKTDPTIIPALEKFVDNITAGASASHLLPHPSRGSACKRLNLFLRWMVRKDDVDPGVWIGVPRSKLIIPLDTHMHKISVLLGFTKRKQGNLITALEITRKFAEISPDDPVKYDFVLTRLGIRQDMNYNILDSF